MVAGALACCFREGGLAPRDDPRLRRGLGRGPVDDRGGDRGERPGASDQRGPVRALRLAAGRVLRRQGERGPAEPVRRPRRPCRREGEGEPGSALMAVAQAENPLLEGLRVARTPEPCALVIFGASGDLTRRKLLPAVYSLAFRRLLPEQFGVVGVARTEETTEAFRARMKEAVQQFGRDELRDDVWDSLASGMRYVGTEFADDAGFDHVAKELDELSQERGTGDNRVYYLAIPPDAIQTVVDQIGRRRAESGWTRLIVEKPFGHDRASAHALTQDIRHHFREQEIFRIDHYLGKETVQNLLALRFANGIFEPIWSRQFVDHVQITVAETLGIENRAGYYEQAG